MRLSIIFFKNQGLD